MTKGLPEWGNGALCEFFKNLNGTLTWQGRYFGQSFDNGNNLLRVNMDILIQDLGNVVLGTSNKESLKGSKNSVLLMVTSEVAPCSLLLPC